MRRANIIRGGLALLIVLALALGARRPGSVEHPVTGGETMGTTYSLKIAEKVDGATLEAIAQRIDHALAEVNAQMSTWDPASEISRFNAARTTEFVECSPAFLEVAAAARDMASATGGAFDPTLQPLLNLWGFGSGGDGRHVPTPADIAATRERTGWQKLSVGPRGLRKDDPELSLALGAIAKGYGVDALGAVLDEFGLENWFVEIGGEIAVRGHNSEGGPWRLGVQRPTTNPLDFSYVGVVHLTNGALATSGDYRNYVEEDGVVYSHLLDPRTGRAVKSDLASVTVAAPTCTEADAAATALFVMGPEEGTAWVEDRPAVEALFLVRTPAGDFREIFSSGFKKTTGYSHPDSVKEGRSNAWIVFVGCLLGLPLVFWLWRHRRAIG